MGGKVNLVCVECGSSDNPLRCKVVAPTLALLGTLATAAVEWPLGAFVYIFRHRQGRKIMSHPICVVYPSINKSFPI